MYSQCNEQYCVTCYGKCEEVWCLNPQEIPVEILAE